MWVRVCVCVNENTNFLHFTKMQRNDLLFIRYWYINMHWDSAFCYRKIPIGIMYFTFKFLKILISNHIIPKIWRKITFLRTFSFKIFHYKSKFHLKSVNYRKKDIFTLLKCNQIKCASLCINMHCNTTFCHRNMYFDGIFFWCSSWSFQK